VLAHPQRRQEQLGSEDSEHASGFRAGLTQLEQGLREIEGARDGFPVAHGYLRARAER
jgi:hypothetical protein